MRLTSPVLVGRDPELAVLTAALGHVASTGTGAAVVVLGDAGIGKTRLVGEVCRRTDLPVLRGRAGSPVLSVAYRPLAEALVSAFPAGPPPDDPALDGFRPVLGRMVPRWCHPGDPGRADSALVVAEAVLRVLAVVGRPRGCVLVLEDLHDADPETLGAVEYLMDNLDRHPVLLLATARDLRGPALDLFAAAHRRRVADLVELGPLSPGQVAVLATRCLGTAPSATVLERLRRDGEGNPFVVEELLAGMAAPVAPGIAGPRRMSGLAGAPGPPGPRGREANGEPLHRVPVPVSRAVADRVGAGGADLRDALRIAALLGRQFPAAVLADAADRDGAEVDRLLRAARDAGLVTPDPTTPGWYRFRHALTGEALLADLPPSALAPLAARVAAAVARAEPGLPGEWCERVAALRERAGDPRGAADLLATAGRRALDLGRARAAVTLLERAADLRGDHPPDLLEPLLRALRAAGRPEGALAFADAVHGLVAPPVVLAGLHLRLAEASVATGRWADGRDRIATVRALLTADPDGATPDPPAGTGTGTASNADPAAAGSDVDLAPAASRADLAAVDVLESLVLTETPDAPPGRAEHLARRAAATARAAGLPELACRAGEVLGLAARSRSFAESDAEFGLVLRTAEEHGLGGWRLDALAYLGTNDMLRDGEYGHLDAARAAAVELGVPGTQCAVDSLRAMLAVLRGEHDRLAELFGPCRELTGRLGYRQLGRYLTLASAVHAGHRGRRPEMDGHVAALAEEGGADTHYLPIAWGLGGAVCALLEEDRPRARADLARAREHERAAGSPYGLSGGYGLDLLLGVLDGDRDLSDVDAVLADPRSGYRWNRQFVAAAEGVLHGRAGRPGAATRAMGRSRRAAEVFPLAGHLVLRLVAEAAYAADWGDPQAWTRQAEQYFHDSGQRAVAAACRGLLRGAGTPVGRRRAGWEAVPPALRDRGVTVREYEVLGLLATGLGNRDIGRGLFLSPRTVEKHVSAMLAKLGCADRGALARYATGRGFVRG
ncbi:helix-turn-helix transcriptional regulator [Longispora urticae]